MIQEQTSAPTTAPPVSLPRLLAIGVSARVVIDTGVQIFGPFLELIARGMGISIVTLGWMNSLRNMTGLAIPVAGVLADRVGYRPVMRGSLWLGSLGLFIFALGQQLWINTIGMVVMGLGLFTFVPVFQAYLSARIPYNRRAQALGIVEYAWALAGIFGLSVSGLLIERFGWRAPFFVLGTCLFLSSFLFGALPSAQISHSQRLSQARFPGWGAVPGLLATFMQLEINRRSAWSAMVVTAVNVFATSHVGIVYGSWLTREYGLSAVQLGTAALVFGLVELTGSILVSVLADRVGKYRSVVVSTICALFAYALLPSLNVGLAPAIAGLMLVRFTFEISMVSNLSLISEQVPQQRAKVLTMTASFVTVAVALSSITGPYAYSRWGVPGLGLVSAAATLISVILLILWVREHGVEQQHGE